MDRTELSRVFKHTSGKTLKTELRAGMSVSQGIDYATQFVHNNSEGYTRVEFRFEDTYYVVAKLKDRAAPIPIADCLNRHPVYGWVCKRPKGHSDTHTNGIYHWFIQSSESD